MLTPEQREARLTGLGGSDAGAIAGVNPYAGPFDVWARFHVPDDGPEVETEAAEWGHALEPLIAEKFAQRMGLRLIQPRETFRHPTHDWMIGHVDRLSEDGRVLVEVKTAGLRGADRWGDEGTDEVPEEYRLQVAHYCVVRPDVEVAFIPVLIGGQDFRIYEIPRDRELEEMLVDLEHDFWTRHVLTGEPPPLDSSPRAREWASHLYPRALGPEREADEECIAAAVAYDKARAALAVATARRDAARSRLVELIGDTTGFRWGRNKATWTNNKDAAVTDWEAVARALRPSPELIAAHTRKTTGTRVLRVSIKE